MKLTKDLTYLLGLIAGRGYLVPNENRVIIEIAHKNYVVKGIPRCPDCGGITTKRKENNPNKKEICQDCKKIVENPKYKQKFNQREEVLKTVENFLSKKIKEITDSLPTVSGNKTITFLSIDLSKNPKLFDFIKILFKNKNSFDSFEIPNEIKDSNAEMKVEFIKGLADVAGFPTWSGWVPRTEGLRARIYLQIVRNWKLTAQLYDLLQDDLKIPVQTIDWGHPNIRDPDMIEYIENGEEKGGVAWGREHQIKIFPEYFKKIGFRFSYKQAIFEELVEYNEKLNFKDNELSYPPTKISRDQYKIKHAGENSNRLPIELRGQHFDAYWQICWKLGCSFTKNYVGKKYEDLVYLTGMKFEEIKKLPNEEIKKIRLDIEKARQEKLEKDKLKWSVIKEKLKKKESKKLSGTAKLYLYWLSKEKDLYDPLAKWLYGYLKKIYPKLEVLTYDTSKHYLSKFMTRNNLIDIYETYSEYDIKPDVVGFIKDNKEFVFIEAKVGPIELKNIGQLLGYCYIAKPKLAFIISPEYPSGNLIKTLEFNKELLKYSKDSYIKIGVWKEKEKNVEILYPK